MAHAADCVAQRLKSLEMTASGSNWAVSQRVEVVPPEKGQLSSRAEAQAAAKENKEEMKSRNLAKGKDKGKGEYSQGYWRSSGKGDQKGKEKSKGKKGGDKEENKRSSYKGSRRGKSFRWGTSPIGQGRETHHIRISCFKCPLRSF